MDLSIPRETLFIDNTFIEFNCIVFDCKIVYLLVYCYSPTKRNMDNCTTPSTIGKSDYENDTWRNQKKARLVKITCQIESPGFLVNVHCFSVILQEDQISEYGQRAYRDLSTKRGKDFRTQKTKKKRGIYRGGKIDLQPRSIKF